MPVDDRVESPVSHVEAERDHWRTLLEISNAVATKRDAATLRAAIAPNVQRMVQHDHTNVFLIDQHGQLEAFEIDPSSLAWPDALASEIRLGDEPYSTWLAPSDCTVDIDVENSDPTGWEAVRAQCLAAGVKRICNAPLSTPHRRIGILSIGRLSADPFTAEERDRVTHVAAQIAIALENAMAFEEIASLKEQLARENVYLREEIRGNNFRFHFRLYERADLPQTLEFVRVLWAKYPFDLLGSVPGRLPRVLDEHAELLAVLKEKDPRKAAKAMQAHISSGHRDFKATYALEPRR